MRTTTSTSGITGKARRAPVVTTLAALCLALPMSGIFGGTAFATNDKAASDHGASSAPGQQKKADPGSSSATTASTDSSTSSASSSADSTPGNSDHSQGNASTSGSYNQPQPYSNADSNNTGANDTSASNPYRSTRDGSPSMNGNGGGNAGGKPCAGCVGKADNKNPKGQAPGGSDHNNGYECDGNNGIGKGNPAHTGCTTGGTTPPPPSCVPTAANHHCDTDTPPPGCVPTAANHHCDTDKACPNGSPMPASGDCGGGDHGNKNDKVTICHATGSASNPFVVITPNKNGVVHGHAKHGDDIIPPFDYNDHGVTKHFPGLNWTAANQAAFHNGCSVPAAPKCPNGSAMPASGNIADCTPPVVCPAGSTMVNGVCTPPVVCPAGSTMVNGVCTPPVVCPSGSTMVNGVCTPPVVCPEGTQMAPGATSCTPPLVCPNGAMVGPIVPGTARPGCPIEGGTGNGAQTPPVSAPVPTVIGQGTTPQAVQGGTPTPAVVSARPTALPFTGSNAGLLAEGAALMLLIGTGLVVAARRKVALAA
ncbi:MAG: Conserved putative secreted protein [Frankiales bacterium]|nr:Conserved putative secreted protein [Frankiales bacterium]